MMNPGGHGGGTLLGKRPGRSHLVSGDAGISPLLRHLVEAAEAAPRFQATGEVVRVIGTTVEAAGEVADGFCLLRWVPSAPASGGLGLVAEDLEQVVDGGGEVELAVHGADLGGKPGGGRRHRQIWERRARSWNVFLEIRIRQRRE